MLASQKLYEREKAARGARQALELCSTGHTSGFIMSAGTPLMAVLSCVSQADRICMGCSCGA